MTLPVRPWRPPEEYAAPAVDRPAQIDRRTWATSTAPASARIELTTARSGRATLDGGWWPTSRDPVVELSSLVIALTGEWGAGIERVMLNPAGWDRHPRRIEVGGVVLRVGWFGTLDTALVILTGAGDLRLDLLVVPPPTAIAVATAAMHAASRPDNTTPAADWLPAPAEAGRSPSNHAGDPGHRPGRPPPERTPAGADRAR